MAAMMCSAAAATSMPPFRPEDVPEEASLGAVPGEAPAAYALPPGIVKEHRPWGWYAVLLETPAGQTPGYPGYKVKLLCLHPGHRLSLQLHHHRDEHWVIVRGQALLTLGERTWEAGPGEAIDVPRQMRHRIANAGHTPLELIEVQQGDAFDESDIVRFADDYQRVATHPSAG
jgi:mannose-6-phosphate isomerase-like protein (cupin superfamily)